MGRRVHDLLVADLAALPQSCRACVFWEADGAPRGPRGPEGVGAKEAWWQATQLEWGTPGKAVYADGRLIGFALFAPGMHYPRVRRLGPVSDDALLLATLWVAPDARGTGVSRLLLHSVLRETHRRGCKAVEAFGERRPVGAEATTCVLSEDFLLSVGFAVVREHLRTPLLRLDLRRTARLQESVEHALEGVLAALGRRERQRAAAPAPR